MKRTLTLIVIAFACLSAAGCVSTQSIKVLPPPTLSEPDRSLLVLCLGPVRLPKGQLTQRDVERLWISDRKALIECGSRQKALRDYYHDRDAAIRGAASK
ncbi:MULTISPECIES: dehydrogenase [unclassified Mesorhizobium]|uniref:Rz1-like lysis system protein LysC n=1 Tax=unclassified Mesorhizobium TaxID=325217 RepID=UPI001AEDF295|nr:MULTISPECIES: dehydrogenase [unclassified Mesorhizobium]